MNEESIKCNVCDEAELIKCAKCLRVGCHKGTDKECGHCENTLLTSTKIKLEPEDSGGNGYVITSTIVCKRCEENGKKGSTKFVKLEP